MPTFHAADGAALAYTELGPRGGIPLLFLHGWLGDGGTWAAVCERLAAHHRTIAVDLRGFGASNDAPGPYHVEALADDLSALVAALDLDPVVAIGHSMGAGIAQRFAVDRPDAVEALVLIAPVPPSPIPLSPAALQMFRDVPGDATNTAAWLGKLTHREPAAEVVALMRRAAGAVRTPAALESLSSWTALDFAADVATIETPTLVLAPAFDRPMTPQLARQRVADLIAGSRFEIVAEAGHYAPLERPEAIADAIERFVRDL
ncbi:MAG: alpha/beta hydrolase [Vulcanimicrobiaceae bacterium]